VTDLIPTVQPAEHCGDILDLPFEGGTTECVLRPGHSGSHANETGTRWRLTAPVPGAHTTPCVHPAGYEGECPCKPSCGCCTATAVAPAPEPGPLHVLRVRLAEERRKAARVAGVARVPEARYVHDGIAAGLDIALGWVDHLLRDPAPAPEPGLRERIRRACAEAEGFRFESLEPHDYQRHAEAVLNVRDTELEQLRAERDAAVEQAEEGQAALEMYGLWQRRAENARRKIERVRAIPRLPHHSQQTGELGRAYTRGWESVINAIDTAVDRPRGECRRCHCPAGAQCDHCNCCDVPDQPQGQSRTRAESHAAAVEQIRTAAGGLYATTGLRVLDALDQPQE
jgi:hypothetical protein